MSKRPNARSSRPTRNSFLESSRGNHEMQESSSAEDFSSALAVLSQTESRLEKTPPGFHVATAHDDRVMLFLVRIQDHQATSRILSTVIALGESESIQIALKETGGLIKKQIPIDDALKLKQRLLDIGTEVEFVLPN